MKIEKQNIVLIFCYINNRLYRNINYFIREYLLLSNDVDRMFHIKLILWLKKHTVAFLNCKSNITLELFIIAQDNF